MDEKTKDNVVNNVDDIDENNLPDANILVAGITGTGKSTLLNAVFGDEAAKTGTGKPVTDRLQEYSNKDTHIHIWDTVGLELDSEKTEQSINDIRNTIAEKATSENQFDRIHAIWYCINSGSNRYQEEEIKFIKKLHSIGVPFIIVLTQCTDIESKINAFEEIIRKINADNGMADIDIVQVCAKDFETRLGVIPAFGLEELVDLTLKKLPEFIKDGFIAAQRVSKAQKRITCETKIEPVVREAYDGKPDNLWIANIVTTNKKIKGLLKTIAEIYNQVLSDEQLEEIQSRCQLDWENIRDGLLNPLNREYSERITKLFMEKKEEGFTVSVEKIPEKKKSARMIAYYGYTFIDAVEEVWDEVNAGNLTKMQDIIDKLCECINKRLNDRKESKSKAKMKI